MSAKYATTNPFVGDTNPFADHLNPCKQVQAKITKTKDGITPTTMPLAIIIGLVVGIIAHCIAAHFTSNAHYAVYAGISAGGAAAALTIGHAVLCVRKNLDEKVEAGPSFIAQLISD